MDLEYWFRHERGFPKFLEQWMAWGAAVDGDMYKFFCYFTAFNFLYSHCCEEDCGDCNLVENRYEQCKKLRGIDKTPPKAGGEQCMICQTINSVLTGGNNFDPFKGILTEDSEIIKQPVHSMNRNKPQIQVIYNDCKLLNVQKLFLNIYYVRCNLYHGSKAMYSDRDKALVKESAKVLKYFLDYVINKYTN